MGQVPTIPHMTSPIVLQHCGAGYQATWSRAQTCAAPKSRPYTSPLLTPNFFVPISQTRNRPAGAEAHVLVWVSELEVTEGAALRDTLRASEIWPGSQHQRLVLERGVEIDVWAGGVAEASRVRKAGVLGSGAAGGQAWLEARGILWMCSWVSKVILGMWLLAFGFFLHIRFKIPRAAQLTNQNHV